MMKSIRKKKALSRKCDCQIKNGFKTPFERFMRLDRSILESKYRRKHPVVFDLKKLTKNDLVLALLQEQWWPQGDFPVIQTKAKSS